MISGLKNGEFWLAFFLLRRLAEVNIGITHKYSNFIDLIETLRGLIRSN